MDDLISEFIRETTESLTVLDTELVKLERNPDDREILSTIYRLMHTIKGTCGFLELKRLETVAEAVEEVLAKVHDGEIAMTRNTGFVLLEALSSIRHIVSHLAEAGCEPEGDDSNLIARLKQAAATTAPKAAQAPVQKPKLVEKETGFAEPRQAASLPPVAMSPAPMVPVELKKPSGGAMSAQAKQQAIRHGLQVAASSDKAATLLSRGLLEKLAGALENLIHARNQLKAGNAVAAPLARLNAATQALKEILAVAEQETAQPSPVKVLSVLVAYAAGHLLALPQRYILEVVDLFADRNLRVDTINRTEVLIKGKRVIPLVKLRSLLRLSDFPSMREDQVVILRVGDAEFGLVTERVGSLMEVVLEKLPRSVQPLAIYQGAALLNDKKLVMVMDAAGLARAIGFKQVQDIAPDIAAPAMDRNLKGFVVFRAGTGALKALLVDQVARIDEAAARPADIRIATIPGIAPADPRDCELVVLQTGPEPVALAVEKVIDVRHAPLVIKPHGGNPAYLGTVDLNGVTAELVNLDSILGQRRMEAA